MGVQGLRVIVVEDEALLALEMEDILSDAGYVVVGTAARLGPALELAEQADFDTALLDMNLAGERIDPVARAIAARGLSIIFVTGYGDRTLPHGIAAPVLEKPCSREKLLGLLGAMREVLRG